MNTDLILCAAIVCKKQEYALEQVIKKLDKHKFNNKYILFDGPPLASLTQQKGVYERYTKYKNHIKINYPDFKYIENTDCIYYRKTIETFIRDNFDGLAKNLLIVQDDVLLDDFDLEKVLEIKADFSECKILYFREHRLRCKHWFNTIDDSGVLIKTHGWSERAYLITKEHILEILDNLPHKGGKKGKFIEYYYQNMLQYKARWENLTEEEQLEYWKKWGCYEHPDIRHIHLATKRS